MTEPHDIVWLHRMYYQDNVTSDMAMLPEVKMSVHEISQDTIASMKLEGAQMREPGGIDPVHDETELESYTDDNQPVKLESDAREGDDEDDAVTEASDSDDKPAVKTCSVRMPKKYDGFEMTAAEIRLLQVEASLDLGLELSLIGATGTRFKNTSDLHVMNYKQAMASEDASP